MAQDSPGSNVPFIVSDFQNDENIEEETVFTGVLASALPTGSVYTINAHYFVVHPTWIVIAADQDVAVPATSASDVSAA
jgi:hypothetical protein